MYERVLAVMLLIVSSPLLLVISLAILIESGRPIFYRQRRVGFAGKEFSMLKFRSMVQNADQLRGGLEDSNNYNGALFKVKDDPRVTKVGKFLRRHSLDELPQLLNVAKGEMLLVGPRPCLVNEAEKFDRAAQRRFLARPGLTGLWQVSGRSDLKWDEAVKLDLYYVENWSVLLDLLIVWRTIRVVFGGSGAY
jgi:lipopolysaccharide/colanic/teichoic acid biosynthesis glycosyltransferase